MLRDELVRAFQSQGATEFRPAGLLISSDVLFFKRPDGSQVVAVPGSRETAKGKKPVSPKECVDALIDAIYWARQEPELGTFSFLIGKGPQSDISVSVVDTLLSAIRCSKPSINIEHDFVPRQPSTPAFGDLSNWAKMLKRPFCQPLLAAAKTIEARVGIGFKWYRIISSSTTCFGRVEGLNVCSASWKKMHFVSSFSLGKPKGGTDAMFQGLANTLGINLSPTGEEAHVDTLTRLLAARRSDPVLRDLQPEHVVESRIISGHSRILDGDGRALGLIDSGVPFQFPARWSALDPNRHIDLLMRYPGDPRPWVVELKAGSEGEYLRHAIGQAALYREFIRNADALSFWFEAFGLDIERCEAAVALASTKPKLLAEAKDLGEHFGVQIFKVEG